VRLWRELGLASFLVMQVLFAGMLVSAVVHPVLLGTLVYLSLAPGSGEALGSADAAILVIDVVNITLGYLTFLMLGRQTLLAGERAAFWKTVLLTPFYWCLLSLAAWRSLWKLYLEPHHWEKTHHPARRPAHG
jgi:hypothetical protein